MAKFGPSLFVGMLATAEDGEGVDVGPRASIWDGDGVDVGTKDGLRASTWDEDGLTSIGGGDGLGAILGGLTGINTEDGDEVDDDKLSRGGNSLTTYHFFFAIVPLPLESCDGGRGGSAPHDEISIYRKIIL